MNQFRLLYVDYGLTWFVGSAFIGMLYDRTMIGLIGFAITIQAVAMLILF